jgi:hypothetical protein
MILKRSISILVLSTLGFARFTMIYGRSLILGWVQTNR